MSPNPRQPVITSAQTVTQSNNRERGKKHRNMKQSNMKTSHQSPALLINEMSKAGGQCQKNPGAGNDQVACEKYAAECTLDEGPLDTMSGQYATGSTNIDEPNVKVSPDDVSSDWVSRGMDTRKGCGKRTAKSVETHMDSNSAATIDDDDIYSGNVESSSDERRDINEVTASNHHQATNPALHTKNTTGGSDPVDIPTKAQVTQADTTPGKETRSTTQVDSHKSREPWHTWAKDRKQQLHDRLQEKIEHLQAERTCKVCLSAEVSRAFRPCGHLSCCAACAKQMKDCPICRQPVQGSVVVVLPKPRRKALPMDFELFLQRHGYFGL